MISQLFDKYFSINLPNNVTTYETDKYIFGYLPIDYYVTDTLDESFISTFTFSSNNTYDSFLVSIHKGSSVLSQHDVMFTNVSETQINAYNGFIIKSDNDNYIEIIWTDTINVYSVSGTLSEQELKKIAENISPKFS